MLKKAYHRGFRAAIKEAQENGLLGKITDWADKNPSIAAGILGHPMLKSLQTVQQVDPEADHLRSITTQALN